MKAVACDHPPQDSRHFQRRGATTWWCSGCGNPQKDRPLFECRGGCANCMLCGVWTRAACSLGCAVRLNQQSPLPVDRPEYPWSGPDTAAVARSPLHRVGNPGKARKHEIVFGCTKTPGPFWEFLRFLLAHDACDESLQWLADLDHDDLRRAWDTCPDANALLWTAFRVCPDRRAPLMATVAMARLGLVAMDDDAMHDASANILADAEAMIRGDVSAESLYVHRLGVYFGKLPDKNVYNYPPRRLAELLAEEAAYHAMQTILLDRGQGRTTWLWTSGLHVFAAAECALRLAQSDRRVKPKDLEARPNQRLADEVRRHVPWCDVLTFIDQQDRSRAQATSSKRRQ